MDSISKIIIEINGKPLKDFENVAINQNMYGIDSFEINCRFESFEKIDGFLIENSKDFLGMPIVIQTKTGENNEEKDCLLFKGYVTEIQGTRTGMSDNDQIIISGGSSEIILDRKPTNRAFLDKTLNEIVKEVLKPYPLKSKINSREKQQFAYVVQYEESDLEFLKRLSIRYGEWLFFNGKELIFGEIPEVEQWLTVGYNLEEFNYQLRVSPVKFNLFSVDPIKMDVFNYKSGKAKVDPNLNIYGKHALKQSKQMFPEEGSEYYEHLNAGDTQYKNALDRVGEISEIKDAINLTDLSGSSSNGFLSPGVQAMINSPKEDFREMVGYGRHLITSVQHSFDNLLTYQNNFTAIPAESTLPEYTNPNFVKETQNQLGVVTDNVDPEKLGRVRVSFWWMEGKGETQWIKVTTPYATKNGGFYFIPAISSRVLVGFEGGNVEKPYCIGELFNEDNSPDSAWAGNYNDANAKIHAIRTESGHTIEFHDGDGEEKITIYDKDDKNRITLDSANGQLSIHADGNLKFSADKIEMNANSGIEIISQQGMKLQAAKAVELTTFDKLEITVASNFDLTIGASYALTVGSSMQATIGSAYLISAGGATSISSGAPMTFTGPIIKIN